MTALAPAAVAVLALMLGLAVLTRTIELGCTVSRPENDGGLYPMMIAANLLTALVALLVTFVSGMFVLSGILVWVTS